MAAFFHVNQHAADLNLLSVYLHSARFFVELNGWIPRKYPNTIRYKAVTSPIDESRNLLTAMPLRFLPASIVLAVTVLAAAQATAHRGGPDGLDGWLVRERVATLENQGPLPTSLVIARNGRVIRRLSMQHDGGPFYWNFVFLPDGKQVAFEQGSLHFNLTCTLMDIETGEHIQDYDCFHTPISNTAPQWVKRLEATPNP